MKTNSLSYDFYLTCETIEITHNCMRIDPYDDEYLDGNKN